MKSVKKFLLLASMLYQATVSFGQVTAQFTINDQTPAAGSPVTCFINNSLIIQSQCSGDITSYSVTITDAASHAVATTGTVHANVPATIDLYNGMCDGTGDCIPLSNTLQGDYTINIQVADDASNSSSYSGTITLTSPTSNPANVSFKLNNTTVSATTNTNFNGISALEMENNSTGDIAVYKIEVWDASSQNIVYTTGYLYATPPATINMFDMCGDGTCASLNPDAYGTYNVKLWASSTGVDDPLASSYTGIITINPAVTTSGNPPHASFTVNDQELSATEATPFYNSESLMLRNTSSGEVAVYKIEVLSEDLHTVLYSTGFVQGNFDNINLFDMCNNISGNCSSLNSTIAGTYGIRLTLSPCCSYDVTGTSVKLGLIAIIPGYIATNTTLITSALNISTSEQDDYLTPNTNASSPDRVGRISTVFNFLDPRFNRLYTSGYTISLVSWDAASASWSSPSWSATYTNTESSPSLSPYTSPISIIGGAGFFSDASKVRDGSIWKIDVTLTNDGSSYTETEVFQIDDADHL